MRFELPEPCLVLLVGASGSGKSTFAARHFSPTEIVSSDHCRALVADDPDDQSASTDAFAVLHTVVERRLMRHRITVVDATNVQIEARRALIQLARRQNVIVTALVFDLPTPVLLARTAARAEAGAEAGLGGRGRAPIAPRVIHQQQRDLHRGLKTMRREGLSLMYVFDSEAAVDAAEPVRAPLRCDRRHEAGPFDLVGDVHGCIDELRTLLARLGYGAVPQVDGTWAVSAPPGRRLVFLGDLVDRGPGVAEVLALVMQLVRAGHALCVPGNHDLKLVRKLRGRDVTIAHGLAESLEQLDRRDAAFRAEVADFLEGLPAHLLLDGGRLVAAHAGLKAGMHGRAGPAVRDFALFGETTGEIDDYGLPVRLNWALEYAGRATVAYGHTPVPSAEWINGTIDLDTGCVFGGALTALRYPERELVSVPAAREYYAPRKPLAAPGATPQPPAPPLDVVPLDLAPLLGVLHLETRLGLRVRVSEGESAAALESLSRFAVDSRWLIYLPPTMSPPETSARPDLLEHPDEAFAFYREQGQDRLVCQKKHMGSRAIALVLRRPDVALSRFGFERPAPGIVYTRTGRAFFTGSEGAALEAGLLDGLRAGLEAAGLFDLLRTDWLLLDAELLPWSLKASALIEQQYALTGAAAEAGLSAAVAALRGAPAAASLLPRFEDRLARVRRYDRAWRPYCWPVRTLSDLRIAPFHLLAAEGRTFFDESHLWHIEQIERLAEAAPGLVEATPYHVVDFTEPDSVAAGVRFWEELTAADGEGMVVKPWRFVQPGPRGFLQPAVKVRGREYLRIIYGPEYDAPHNLDRLRGRALKAKRRLALSEFALGHEALSLFTERAPLGRVHACVFGVLALESDPARPVDPRL